MHLGKILESVDHRIDSVVVENCGSVPVISRGLGKARAARVGDGGRFRKREAANCTKRISNRMEAPVTIGAKKTAVVKNLLTAGAEGGED